MNRVINFLTLLFLSSSIFGQDLPPLPSVEKVFEDIKANKYVYESLKNKNLCSEEKEALEKALKERL